MFDELQTTVEQHKRQNTAPISALESQIFREIKFEETNPNKIMFSKSAFRRIYDNRYTQPKGKKSNSEKNIKFEHLNSIKDDSTSID